MSLRDVDYQLQAVWALIIGCANRGAASEALAMGDRFANLAQQASDPQDQVIARRLRGKSLHFLWISLGSRRETEAGMLESLRAAAIAFGPLPI